MALRTFTLPGVFLTGATTLAPVAKYEPPFRDPILDATRRMPDTWVSWFTRTSDRLADHETRIDGLEARMTALEARVTAAEAQISTINGQISTIFTDLTTAFDQIQIINDRLAAAGIP